MKKRIVTPPPPPFLWPPPPLPPPPEGPISTARTRVAKLRVHSVSEILSPVGRQCTSIKVFESPPRLSNIYPREVEEILLLHASVSEVSVVGRESGEWGEEVVAFVVIERGHKFLPETHNS